LKKEGKKENKYNKYPASFLLVDFFSLFAREKTLPKKNHFNFYFFSPFLVEDEIPPVENK
jgi:hypothetical protein